MKEETKFVELLVKVGALFAQCDGFVDIRETQFIEFFVNDLKQKRIEIDMDSKELVALLHESVDFDALTKEVNLFLSQIEKTESQKIVNMISEFIDKLIKADNVIAKEEIEMLNRWNKTICIS